MPDIACLHCGYPNAPGRSICYNCQKSLVVQPTPPPVPPDDIPSPPVDIAAWDMSTQKDAPSALNTELGYKGWLIVAGVLLIGLVWFWGSFHIVSSSTGMTVIPKVAFSFKETMVSVEEITGMPYLAARARYPLAVQALQREHIIESDESFNARIEEESKAKVRAAEEEARQDLERRMSGLK
jgi:hypothetical protein